jgi:GNAT superfamily N-acetyltransferase
MSQDIAEPPDLSPGPRDLSPDPWSAGGCAAHPVIVPRTIKEWRRGPHLISTDWGLLDFDVVHGFLREAYWSRDIPRATVERAARHSLPFGLYLDPSGGDGPQQIGPRQIGYARVLTDYVGVAYLMDVFVLEPHRGQGLARWLVDTMLAYPDFRDVRAWLLRSRDDAGLYERSGFEPLVDGQHYRRYSRHRGYGRG